MAQTTIHNEHGERIDISRKEKRVRIFHHDIAKAVYMSSDSVTPGKIMAAFSTRGFLVSQDECQLIALALTKL